MQPPSCCGLMQLPKMHKQSCQRRRRVLLCAQRQPLISWQANGSMNHNGHSVGYKGGSKGNGNSSAGWKDWRWDSSDSWNNWKSDGGSWNAWSSSANANAASANAASAGAPSGGNDDSDDETWGKWTPKDTKKPAETPEPEAKRRASPILTV